MREDHNLWCCIVAAQYHQRRIFYAWLQYIGDFFE